MRNRAFLGGETILCDTIIMGMPHYAFVKTHRSVQHKERALMCTKDPG